MKTFKFLLTLFIAVTAAFVLYGCSGSDCDNGAIGASHIAPAAKGTITGTVRDTNGNPIGGVNIAATNIRASAVTAEDGTYSITDLAFGVYSVTAVHNGTTLDTKEVTISSTTPQAIADFVIPLPDQNGTISGTIKNFDGTVPASATIELLDSANAVIKTVTTTTGTFIFENIALGTYTVRALPQTDTDSPSGQAIVSETALNPTVDLQYQLIQTQKGTISGTIKFDDGTVPASATIELLDSANAVIKTVDTTTGTFIFENIELGTYTVRALPQADTDSPSGQAIVSETALNPTVDLQYAPLKGTISGTIKFDDEESTVPELATIELVDSTNKVIKTVDTTTGEFKFEDIELGTYTVRALPQAFEIDGETYPYTDSPSGKVTVSETTLNPTVDLVYTTELL